MKNSRAKIAYFCTNSYIEWKGVLDEVWVVDLRWFHGERLFPINNLAFSALDTPFEEKYFHKHISSKGFNLISIQQLDLRHMNQLPTNNSIGIAMDLRSHIPIFLLTMTISYFIFIPGPLIFITIFFSAFPIMIFCQGLLHFHRVGCDGGSGTEEWEILSMLWGKTPKQYNPTVCQQHIKLFAFFNFCSCCWNYIYLCCQGALMLSFTKI